MKFQPGQSGNPAGRPLGSLNKKTLALQEAFEAKAEEVVDDVIARAKNGQPAAMRLVMERAVPMGRNRRIAIDLPVITTADDAEAALAVVMAELAAGNLAVHELSSLLHAIERALRLAERIWKMRQREREWQQVEAVAQSTAETAHDPTVPAAAAAAKSADRSGERLYFPVNQGTPAPAECTGARTDRSAPATSGAAVPEAKAA
jgi:hypothetical protein